MIICYEQSLAQTLLRVCWFTPFCNLKTYFAILRTGFSESPLCAPFLRRRYYIVFTIFLFTLPKTVVYACLRMRPRRLTLPQPWITHSCFAVFAVCARFLLSLYIRFTIILAARTRKDYTVGRYVFIAILCREHCLRGLYPVTLRFRALRAASEQDLCLLAIVKGFILTAMPQLMVKALSQQAMRRHRATRINCPCYYLNSSNSRSILNRIILVMFL